MDEYFSLQLHIFTMILGQAKLNVCLASPARVAFAMRISERPYPKFEFYFRFLLLYYNLKNNMQLG